jgi:hypothetical protein
METLKHPFACCLPTSVILVAIVTIVAYLLVGCCVGEVSAKYAGYELGMKNIQFGSQHTNSPSKTQ